MPGTSRISVVLLAYGEGDTVTRAIEKLRSQDVEAELVVVAPEGELEHLELEEPGARRAVCQAPGRGAALDAGAATASGEVLLFLHCDTCLPAGGLRSVAEAMEDPRIVGGWFRRRLDDERWRFRMVDVGANGFSLVSGIATGDQALFCRRKSYEEVGPLAAWPLFEDMTLCRRLRNLGPMIRIDAPVRVSPRRFLRRGVLRTVSTNLYLTLRYFRGEDPVSLYQAYYGHPCE